MPLIWGGYQGDFSLRNTWPRGLCLVRFPHPGENSQLCSNHFTICLVGPGSYPWGKLMTCALCPVFSRKVFFRGNIGYANTFRYKHDVNNNSNTDHWCNLREKRKKRGERLSLPNFGRIELTTSWIRARCSRCLDVCEWILMSVRELRLIFDCRSVEEELDQYPGRGTAIYGPCRCVPLWRVRFSSSLL